MIMQVSESDPILIVDDNVNNLKVLSKALSSAGWTVAVAKTGENALKQVEYQPPALILLDVQMPGIDGFELCKRIKENSLTHQIPVIFMTALSDAGDKIKGFEAGAVDYITKPFQTEDVLARVSVHLKLHSLTKQLEEQNRLLEQRVAERTSALTQSLEELKKAQMQLVQSEKMSTLGQLVSSVAHEINNPLGCISGNITYIETYIKDLLNLIDLYQDRCPDPGDEIEEEIENIDLEYLKEDVPKILSAMTTGTERLRYISNSLRNFSRKDSDQKALFNLHDGIDSTLMILKSRLKPTKKRIHIEIKTEYGSLPDVACYPGQINQVFMNLIANAIDAFDDASEAEDPTLNPKPTITIRTEVKEPTESLNYPHVAIAIRDNGPGISEDVKQHIFDYLFTTKPVGKGTGLGLSISRQIVEEKHGGRLTCISSPENGTEFLIELPIQDQ